MRILIIAFLFVFHASPAQDTVSVYLLFAGDIMQHESQMKAAYDHTTDRYDYTSTFKLVEPIIQSADIAIGNLELTLGGKPYSGYPEFSAPDELVRAIGGAGFDVLVTANNHSLDRGRKGLERTLRVLDSAKVAHTGTFADTLEYLNDYPLVIESKGIRFSLLNYTYGTNGINVRRPNIVNYIDTVRIGRDLQKASKQGTDASIVFFHWGNEYESVPSTKQRELAAFCLRRGVKIVIGSHPHVIQPMEWDVEKDQVVVYSLGNFISGQRVRYRNGGAMVHIVVEKIATNGVSKLRIAEASYSLAWVNRRVDDRRTFQLVPVTDTATVQGPVSRGQMREFFRDSRMLLDKENRGMKERGRLPEK